MTTSHHSAAAHKAGTSRRNRIIALLVAAAVATIGYVLIVSRAAGIFASVTPDKVLLNGNVCQYANSVTFSNMTKHVYKETV